MEIRKESIPWGEIGYITYKRTYSRKLNDNNKNFRDIKLLPPA